MKTNREILLEYLQKMEKQYSTENYNGVTTQELADALDIKRCNVSTLLNKMVQEGLISKQPGRPVRFKRRISHTEESTAFSTYIGLEGSMKNPVQLAKAAVLYPENPLQILITGAEGTGKSHFADTIYDFAKEKGIVEPGEVVRKINCKGYKDSESAFLVNLDSTDNKLLLFEHIDFLSLKSLTELFQYMERIRDKDGKIIICTADSEMLKEEKNALLLHFQIHIKIPCLQERGFEERLQFIRKCFQNEAKKMQKKIRLNSELLYCLMLYPCEGELQQLLNDVRIGCANGYAREYSFESRELWLYVNDFPDYVRRGLLYWKQYADELRDLISPETSVSIEEDKIEERKSEKEKENKRETVYDYIERKESQLRREGIPENEIVRLVSEEIEKDFVHVREKIAESTVDREALAKIVPMRLIRMIEEFLDEAEEKFNRVFPESIVYGLCLHVASSIKRIQKTQHLSNEKLMEIITGYPEEYHLSLEFVRKVEKAFQTQFPIDEVVIITMFLIENRHIEKKKSPVLLITMHGDSGASSVSHVVNTIGYTPNAYAFDLPLEMKMEEAYVKFKEKILEINRGAGVILLYDMGSIKTMAELATQETGIPIRSIEVPLTLLALESSRIVDSCMDISEAYRKIQQSYQEVFAALTDNYTRTKKEKVIIALCMTGMGGAIQIKNYIEKNVEMQEIEVVPLALNDQKKLVETINRLMEKKEVLCMIGTYDPQIYGIPFISVAKLFETPVEKLPMILTLSEFEPASEIDYNQIYEYLGEQLPDINLEKLRKSLPGVVRKLKQAAGGLDEAKELGLFMHLACSVSRIRYQDEVVEDTNATVDQTIMKNKKLYYEIKEILKKLEENFEIQYSDSEICGIIRIIKGSNF